MASRSSNRQAQRRGRVAAQGQGAPAPIDPPPPPPVVRRGGVEESKESEEPNESEEAKQSEESDVENPLDEEVIDAWAGFSLTPGTYQPARLLDYTKKEDYYHYREARKKLQEELYDAGPEGFQQFMKSLGERVNEYGWDRNHGILWMRPGLNQNPLNILKDYGQITLDRVRDVAELFVTTKTCKAQDDRMLYECISKSLSISAKAKVNQYQDLYVPENRRWGPSPVWDCVPQDSCQRIILGLKRHHWYDPNQALEPQ